MSERRKTRKRKRIEYVIGIGFLICVFGIGIINLLLPSKKSQKRKTADCSKSRSFQSARLLPGAIWISMRSIRPISLWEEICGAV